MKLTPESAVQDNLLVNDIGNELTEQDRILRMLYGTGWLNLT